MRGRWWWHLIVAGLHGTVVLCLEWNSGDSAWGHVEVILKHYHSDTIRISLPLGGGWGKDNKKIKNYCLLVCAGMETSTITRSQKMLYWSYPLRTILKLTTKWKVLYHCQAATLGPYHANNCSRISTLCHMNTYRSIYLLWLSDCLYYSPSQQYWEKHSQTNMT
jgi:hypothetical protein